MNFDKYLFRCSALGQLMVEPRSKTETLSETTKSYLSDIYVSEKYGRMKDIQNRFTAKGLMVEEDSLTLYSRFKKEFFVKNEERKSNEFITGCPDIVTNKIIDIKSSWDIFTFFRAERSKLNKMYYWQLQAYMELFNVDSATLVYCLTDTPEVLVNDEKRRLMWKMNVIDDTNEMFIAACAEIDKLMKYNDIDLKDRVIEIEIERDYKNFSTLYDKIDASRKYLNSLHGTT